MRLSNAFKITAMLRSERSRKRHIMRDCKPYAVERNEADEILKFETIKRAASAGIIRRSAIRSSNGYPTGGSGMTLQGGKIRSINGGRRLVLNLTRYVATHLTREQAHALP